MKRILCLLIALLLLVPVAHAEGEFAFTLSSAEGKAGETVTLTGSVENAPVCASYRVIMTYDPAVLKPIEGKNAGSKGLFIINVNAKYQEAPAVNALSADAAKVLEGSQTLFTVTFEVLSTPAEGTAPVKVAYEEFYGADLKRQTPVVHDGAVTFAGQTPPAEEETPTDPEKDPVTPPAETPTEPDTAVPPSTEEPKPEKNENTLPDGNWAVDEKNEEILFVPENGDAIPFVPEFPETIQPNTPTEIPLKDEDGHDVGSITVEKNEEGIISVQNVNVTLHQGGGSLLWLWITLGALLVAGAAAAAAVLVLKKKKETETHE